MKSTILSSLFTSWSALDVVNVTLQGRNSEYRMFIYIKTLILNVYVVRKKYWNESNLIVRVVKLLDFGRLR